MDLNTQQLLIYTISYCIPDTTNTTEEHLQKNFWQKIPPFHEVKPIFP